MSAYDTLTPTQKRGLGQALIAGATNPRCIAYTDVHLIVANQAEPRPGFVANELCVDLGQGVVVSVEGRGKGTGYAVVRANGLIVLHQAPMGEKFEPGDWQEIIARAAAMIGDNDRAASSPADQAPAEKPAKKTRMAESKKGGKK